MVRECCSIQKIQQKKKMILRKDRVHDFIKNSQKYGFVYDEDGAYICKKCLSDSDA